MKLIESQNVVQYPRNGAIVNYYTFEGQNGSLNKETKIINSGGNVVLTAGTLTIQGYRVEIEQDEEILKKNKIDQMSDSIYFIYIELTASDKDCEMDLKVGDKRFTVLQKDHIELLPGVYDYVLAEINIAEGSIQELSQKFDVVKVINLTEKMNEADKLIESLAGLSATEVRQMIQEHNLLKGDIINYRDEIRDMCDEKQDILESGSNIKTINNGSILGSGNIDLQTPLVSGSNIKTINGSSILGSGDINITTSDTLKTINGETIVGTGDISIPNNLIIDGNKTYSANVNASSTKGNWSTALGNGAAASGSASTALGYNAAASGNYSTALGYKAAASGKYSTALGYNATTSSSDTNTMQLGDSSSLSTLRCRVSLTVTSDVRDKTDIETIDSTKALELINSLEPITYVNNERTAYLLREKDNNGNYDENGANNKLFKQYGMCEYDHKEHDKGTHKGSRRCIGLKAQQVQQKLVEIFGSDNYANIVNDNLYDVKAKGENPPVENKLTMTYERLVPFLISAIQEQEKRIEELEKKLKLK